MRGFSLALALLVASLLGLPALALQDGDTLTYLLREYGDEARIVFRVVNASEGVIVVESREYIRGRGGLITALLEPGERFSPPSPWTPEEACKDLYPLAPRGYTGEVVEEGDDYRWYCRYRDGVLVELDYRDPTLTLYMSLEQGPGSLGQAIAVLATLLALAAAGLLWLYRKAKST